MGLSRLLKERSGLLSEMLELTKSIQKLANEGDNDENIEKANKLLEKRQEYIYNINAIDLSLDEISREINKDGLNLNLDYRQKELLRYNLLAKELLVQINKISDEISQDLKLRLSGLREKMKEGNESIRGYSAYNPKTEGETSVLFDAEQ